MKLITVSLFLLLSASLWAFEVPELTGPVVDQAGLLDSQTRTEIETLSRQYVQSDIAQIQVLTLNDLQGEVIEQVSIQVTDKWKLGTKDKDNGILILVSLNPKKIRIEVGQGLEGDIPDVIAKRIIRDVMVPAMKSGNVGYGIYLGVQEIINYIEPSSKEQHQKETAKSSSSKPIKFWFQVIIFILFILFRLFSSPFSRRRGFYGGGFGGGGFGSSGGGGWSGGGGGFSGGGSSGDW